MKALARWIFAVLVLLAFPVSVFCGEICDSFDFELSTLINAAPDGNSTAALTKEMGERWKARLDQCYWSLHDFMQKDQKKCLGRSQAEWTKMKEEDKEYFPNLYVDDEQAVLYEACRRYALFRLRALMLEDVAKEKTRDFKGSDIRRYDDRGRRASDIMDEWFVELYDNASNDAQRLKILEMAKDAWSTRRSHANFYMMGRLVKEKMRADRVDALAMEFPGANTYLRIPAPVDGFYQHTVKNRDWFLNAETEFWRSVHGKFVSAWQSLRLERMLALEVEDCAFTGISPAERRREMYQFKKSDAYIYGKLRNGIFDREEWLRR